MDLRNHSWLARVRKKQTFYANTQDWVGGLWVFGHPRLHSSREVRAIQLDLFFKIVLGMVTCTFNSSGGGGRWIYWSIVPSWQACPSKGNSALGLTGLRGCSLFNPFPVSNLVFPKYHEATSFEIPPHKGVPLWDTSRTISLSKPGRFHLLSEETHWISFPSGNCGLSSPLTPGPSRTWSPKLSPMSLHCCPQVHAHVRVRTELGPCSSKAAILTNELT